MFECLAWAVFMYHHVSLCIIMYHHVSKCVSLCIIMYHHVSSCIIMYHHVSSCITMYQHVSSCINSHVKWPFTLNQAGNPFDKNLIISIGDSLDEYEAASAVKCLLKSKNRESIMHRVKMIRKPSTRELAQQMNDISKLAKLFSQTTGEQNITVHRSKYEN